MYPNQEGEEGSEKPCIIMWGNIKLSRTELNWTQTITHGLWDFHCLSPHIWSSPPSWLSWAAPVQTSSPPSPSSPVWSETLPDHRRPLRRLRRATHRHGHGMNTTACVVCRLFLPANTQLMSHFQSNLLKSAGASLFLSLWTLSHYVLLWSTYYFCNGYEAQFISMSHTHTQRQRSRSGDKSENNRRHCNVISLTTPLPLTPNNTKLTWQIVSLPS